MQRLPKSILLIATRRIGDVLLNTPLLRSMRNAWPHARIDVLVFSGTAGVLEGNPDCNEVIEIEHRPGVVGYGRLIRRLFRHYDLAVTTQAGDRPHILAFLAGRRRVGLINGLGAQTAWKRATAECSVIDHVNSHMVIQNLMLTDVLGIDRVHQVIPPASPAADAELDALLPFNWRREPYAVLHPYPNYRYKQWHDSGWQALIAHFRAQGWRVVLTGGPDPREMDGCQHLAATASTEVTSLAGRVGFGSLARLLGGARCFVGPDTSTSHLAAVCGTPTVALFGPSNPVKWGPWPVNCVASPSPWKMRATPWQRMGNVLLMQGNQDCVPCHAEGCDRHAESSSRCLTELPASLVISAVQELLPNCASIL
jgi:heptosyltransferase-3